MLRFGITSEDVAKTFGIMQSRSYNDDVDETEVFEFPIGRIKDWEVLRKHAAEALVYANPVKYEMAIRSRRVSNHPRETRAYLLNTYRCNGVYRYACQMCHEATANIEAVEIFPNPETELDPINLCLCPNCAAKYRQYRSNTRMMDGFRKAIMDKQEYEVCNGDQVIIQVGDSEIWFAQTHFAEIQELLRLTDAVKENTSKSESECDRECKRSADNAVQFADADEKPGTDVYAAYIGKSVSRKDGFRGVVTGLEPTKDDCYLIVKILSGATNGKDTTSISIEFILQHRGVYSFE